ncbi:uncharacterized protein EAF01_011781 [Botrytis porri]|uniref:uncharacterized protein n=1 Tax=Botrytis porri TaxID=87229 RepID=UPI0018FF31F2|nr:uncharacterized protein EAF01_011781 [Botrytis porri]KAF7882001.1 hypothetical protein EAF01_011781 [Botrytis porri]
MSLSAKQTNTNAEEHDELQHVRIHSQCGACGFLFCVGDRLVAPAEETATIHADCFNLYKSQATYQDKVYRLWFASLRIYPWPGSPALLLPPKPDIDRASRLAADIYNLKQLSKLPSEINTMIWNFSRRNDLLRFSAVLQMIDTLSSTSYDRLVSTSLRHIQDWRRGDYPIINTNSSCSLIQLTIDSKGIKSIQGLQHSIYKPPSQFVVYMTFKASQNLSINFQVG